VVARRAGLEPVFRKEDGSSGQKPRAGRLSDPRRHELLTGETLRASCGGFIAVKVASGGGVKALPRWAETNPGEVKPKRGADRAGSKPPRPGTALVAGSKALKSRAGSLARVKPQAGSSNGTRA